MRGALDKRKVLISLTWYSCNVLDDAAIRYASYATEKLFFSELEKANEKFHILQAQSSTIPFGRWKTFRRSASPLFKLPLVKSFSLYQITISVIYFFIRLSFLMYATPSLSRARSLARRAVIKFHPFQGHLYTYTQLSRIPSTRRKVNF